MRRWIAAMGILSGTEVIIKRYLDPVVSTGERTPEEVATGIVDFLSE